MFQSSAGSNFFSAVGTATAPAYSFVSAPIFLKPQVLALPNGAIFNLPGSGAQSDVFAIDSVTTITAAGAGSTASFTTAFQCTTGIADNSTTISTTAVLATDTSIELAAR